MKVNNKQLAEKLGISYERVRQLTRGYKVNNRFFYPLFLHNIHYYTDNPKGVLEYDLMKCLEEYYNYTGAKWMNLLK